MLPVRASSTVASARIARWLADTLHCPLYDNDELSNEGTIDNLLIINGSTLYCKSLPTLAEYIRYAKNVVWIQNDYTLPPPKAFGNAESPFRKVFRDRELVPHYWSTCGENRGKTPKSAQVNWNVLGYRAPSKISTLRGDDFFYYGAYRQDRAASFEKMARRVPFLNVSSTNIRFNSVPGVRLFPPIRSDLGHHLSSHGVGVYLQDAKSAMNDHCPATRFYEMLSAGLPMCFSHDCTPTLNQYGLDVSPYVVHGPDDADRMMANRDQIAAEQKELWTSDFETTLRLQVERLHASLD